MKLFELNFVRGSLITEGYGRTYDFDYHGDQVTDSRPSVISLGNWTSGRGNNLMAGVNLNYLSPEQKERLQQNLQTVLRSRNLQTRSRTLRRLMPDIFSSAYRTYNKDAVNNVDPGTLKFASVAKKAQSIKDIENTPVPRPKTAPNASIDADDVTSPQLRMPTSADKAKEKQEPSDKKVIPIKPEKPEKTEKSGINRKEQPDEEDPDASENLGTDEIEPDDELDKEEI